MSEVVSSTRRSMNDKTLTALRGSIEKWRKIVAGTDADRGAENCALCQAFFCCEGCPVAEAAHADSCGNTPFEDAWAPIAERGADGGYWAITEEQKAAAQKELDFLISLLPTGETP